MNEMLKKGSDVFLDELLSHIVSHVGTVSGQAEPGRKEYRREDSFPSGGFEVSHNSFTRGFGTVGQVN